MAKHVTSSRLVMLLILCIKNSSLDLNLINQFNTFISFFFAAQNPQSKAQLKFILAESAKNKLFALFCLKCLMLQQIILHFKRISAY